jgi:3-phosphoshikimate 1-carboxyvinyltransferase
MAQAFRVMGVQIEASADRLIVHGKGLWGLSEPDRPIDCGNSGTAIRLLAGLLAGQDFFAILTGDNSIRRRPMGRIVKPLRQMGATIGGRKGGELAPLAVVGSRLRGIAYESPVPSAQVKSSLLLAGLYAEGTTRITEPAVSRDHTERLLRHFGIAVQTDRNSVSIQGRPPAGWSGRADLLIAGDLSAAAFFVVAATVVPGSEVMIEGVGINPTRTGVLEVLKRMGAEIEVLNRREAAGEPIADLRVRSARLNGTRIDQDLIPQTIDELPILCIAAALASGVTVMTGAQELRVKESDRIATMAVELRSMGVVVTETSDGMVIEGSAGRPLRAAACHSHGDHRVAMSMAIAGLRAEGLTSVSDSECIETSFPGFQDKMLDLVTGSDRGL